MTPDPVLDLEPEGPPRYLLDFGSVLFTGRRRFRSGPAAPPDLLPHARFRLARILKTLRVPVMSALVPSCSIDSTTLQIRGGSGSDGLMFITTSPPERN